MAPGKVKKSQQRDKTLKRKVGVEELSSLLRRVDELDLKESFKTFADLPLSEPTASGLAASHYKTLTDIQSRAISHALKGRDVLGAVLACQPGVHGGPVFRLSLLCAGFGG